MDPELWELLEEGDSNDEVAAIIRLGRPGMVPPGVRVVAQFGEIATVRMARGAILDVRGNAEVASIKAPGPPMGPEVEYGDLEWTESLDLDIQPGDERRPAALDVTGRGVVVGCVDWGFDFAHPDFRNPDGSTRILALWDQRGQSHPASPQPYNYGVVHTREAINRALATGDPYTALGYHPGDADLGTGSHGTLVASIAAGNGGGGGPTGIAPAAELVFVHNAAWGEDPAAKLGNSVTLLEAVDFITRTAGERPCAINLSMGRTGEQHDGTTLVEQGLDAVLRAAPGRVICQSTGNYYTRRLHAAGQLRPAEERTFVWEVARADVTPNEFEIWYPGRDKMEVEVRAPDGSSSLRLKLGERGSLIANGQTVGRAYHRATEPNNLDNHIDIFLYPQAQAGGWEVTLIATDIVDGRFHAWIERDAARPHYQSHFRPQDADPTSTTGTICNGLRTIAVGAYDPHRANEPVAPFSSMGPTRDGRVKPDLCAPGVDILGARSAPRDANSQAPLLTRMSGTSFAAPHVTGCVALMLQAAPRPLRIEEVHNLLLANTRQVDFPAESPGRIGSGYLDIERAVEAARQVMSVGPELVATHRGQEAMMVNEEQELDPIESATPVWEAPGIEEADPRRYFILISGGPGPYDKRDIEHDQSWANYVTPPLLLTDTEAKRKAFVAAGEEVWWFVFKPAYERRWTADSGSAVAARKAAVKQVRDRGFTSYVDMIEGRAKEHGWTLRWLDKADDLWKELKSLCKGSISRAWYWGHARDDLWLAVRHDPASGVAVAPDGDEIIEVSDIDRSLKKCFRKGDIDRVNRFIGCNTSQFAEAWAKAFGVWAEGVDGKVNFASINTTGGEPCLVDSAQVRFFSPGGKEDPGEAGRARAPRCGTTRSEAAPAEAIAEATAVLEMEDALSIPLAFLESGESYEKPASPAMVAAGEVASPERAAAALVEWADQIIADQRMTRGPSLLLSEVLSRAGIPDGLTLPANGRLLSAAEIFDAFAYPGRERLRDELERYLEVVALPRAPLDSPLCAGDVLVRRGEAGLGHLCMIAAPEQHRCHELLARGLTPELLAPGWYAHVIEMGARPHSFSAAFARRVADDHGWLGHDNMILRIRQEALEAFAPDERTLDEQATLQDAEAGGAVATAPPRVVAGWPLGVDLYSGNNMDAAGFENLRKRGKVFAIAKSSQGTTPDRWAARRSFLDYYGWIRDSGMIRGSYHFFSNRRSTHPAYGGSVADQANAVIALVKRLTPGDLAPALDLEDEPRLPNGGPVPDGAPAGTGRYPLDQGLRPAEQGYRYRRTQYPNWQDGRDELLRDIQSFQDRVETALGRTPMIYTSHMWADSDMMNNPKVMSQYPLWTVYHGECAGRDLDACDLGVIQVGGWGNHWDFIQYAEDGKQVWKLNPYKEPNINVPGIDFDAYNGTIYGLRGLADMGRPGVALSMGVRAFGLNPLPYIAHAESDGSLHLMSGPRWVDSNLSAGALPGRGADPVLLAAPDALFLYFRSGNELIEATATGGNNMHWSSDRIDALPAPIHDPRAILYGKRRFVVYWGDDDDWHLLTWNGGWSSSGGLLSRAKLRTARGGRSTGQPAVYVTKGVVHVVGRVDSDGHLVDLWLDGATWRHDDITALARDLAPNMPGATYSPCTYETAAGVTIAFRAVRGDIWVITRSDHAPANVTAAARAKPAAGHPTCFVLNDRPHILYRATDRLIYDLWLEGGMWHVAQVCSAQAAADPVATCNGTIALAAVRARDGMMQAAQFDGTIWTCTPTTHPATMPPAGARGDYPGGGGGVAQRSPRRGEAEDDPIPPPVLRPQKLKISGLPEITLTPASGGGFEGFFAKPIHERWERWEISSNKTIELTGRIEIEDAGIHRAYDPLKDAKDLPLAGVKGSVPVKIVKTDGPATSSVPDRNVRPDGTFVFTADITVDGYTRSLTLRPVVDFKGGKRITTTVVVELIDLDGFLALVDAREKARPAGQTHLEFLASVRKIYQGGPKDPLSGAFDQVLYRHRNVQPLVAPGSAEDMRFRLYKDWLYADGVYVDIGHVLTGIEGSPKQEPSKDQGIPLPRRPELIVTWSGDLGSALQAYIKDFWNAVDTGASVDLNDYLLKFASRIDLLGDVDGINIGSAYDPARSLAENLRAYYGSRSRRRFEEFIANSKDDQKKAELPLEPGKKPPRLSKQARQAIAENTRQFLVPFWITGKLYRGADPAKRKLVDEIVAVNSPEMDMVVAYFTRFLEEGLAGVQYVPK